MIEPKDHIIEKITDTLKRQYPDFKGLYFFGSRLKGVYEKDSDYDIAIIFDEITSDKKMSVFGLLSEIEYKNDIFLDVNFSPLQERKVSNIFAII
jgi:predicted nucleotidyltransferase